MGAYPEGPGYWGYGTGRMVYLLATWRSALGTDFGLSEAPGFLRTGEYVNALTGTSGFFFNYSDCGRTRRFSDTLWWFAAQTGRTDWLAREYAALRAAAAEWKGTGKATADVTGRFPALVLLWGRFPLVDAPNRLPLRYMSQGENPVATLRSGFAPNASFLGVKGGLPKYNHGHMDVGSFVFDADGVRWAEDLGSQNYHSIEKLGTFTLFSMRQNSSRWNVFRLNNESHNLVVVGTNRQQVAGFAKIAPAGLHAVQLDLASVYGPCVKTATRTFTLDTATRAATVRDEFAANGHLGHGRVARGEPSRADAERPAPRPARGGARTGGMGRAGARQARQSVGLPQQGLPPPRVHGPRLPRRHRHPLRHACAVTSIWAMRSAVCPSQSSGRDGLRSVDSASR